MVAALVMHHAKIRATEVDNHISVLLLTLMLSYLMVSTVRFRTFREFRRSPLTFGLIAASAASFSVVLVIYDITMLLVFIGGTYIGSGLLEEVITFRRRRRADDLLYLDDLLESKEAVDEEEDEVIV